MGRYERAMRGRPPYANEEQANPLRTAAETNVVPENQRRRITCLETSGKTLRGQRWQMRTKLSIITSLAISPSAGPPARRVSSHKRRCG